MLDKINMIFVWFVVLMLLIRLVKIDNFYFKNGWIASIVAIIVTIISIIISMFLSIIGN